MDAETLVRPVVESAGLELVDVTSAGRRGGRVLRVTIDRDGGVDLDTIADLSHQLSRRLDLDGFEDGRYELEVSSPGVDQPLKTAGQVARAVGARVKVATTEPLGGSSVHVGTLRSATERDLELDAEGTVHRIARSQVASVRRVVDWTAELKGAAG